MLKWIYGHMKFSMRFTVLQQNQMARPWKIDPLIIYIDVNKPDIYRTQEEEDFIKIASAHLENLGYCPIVRY